MKTHSISLFMLMLMLMQTSLAQTADKLVIAHRGASGYLPEHTLEAKAMAYAMGADYIEQDVVMTRDNQLVVLHDVTLDRVTNIAEKFPGRAREDGHFYVLDFNLEEIRRLDVSEGFRSSDDDSGNNGSGNNEPTAIFPGRFPVGKSNFKVHTFAEEIEFIQGLNQSTGKNIGIYPEIKSPWWHRQEGKNLSREILTVLKRYGYTSATDRVYLQTFDFNELRYVATELLPELEMSIPLVQLIAENSWQETFESNADGIAQVYDYSWMHEEGGMQEIARYASGVGPNMAMIVSNDSSVEKLEVSTLVRDAHQAGLKVHPFTFRLDAGRIPQYAQDFEKLLEIFYFQVGVDGVFTDYPDRAVEYLKDRAKSR
ncbi:MAG: glycerophosphodiester phosphodiesterase [Proteobacteria bacterium]|nr:glycerophosphodiester phosphodiesterase [Pseudomonadota bacterium]